MDFDVTIEIGIVENIHLSCSNMYELNISKPNEFNPCTLHIVVNILIQHQNNCFINFTTDSEEVALIEVRADNKRSHRLHIVAVLSFVLFIA